eukprot:5518717-Pleurochrysis_carterae.AAC.1
MYPSRQRLPMKPKQLPATTARLRMRTPSASAVAIVSTDEVLPRTTSSSGITCKQEHAVASRLEESRNHKEVEARIIMKQ